MSMLYESEEDKAENGGGTTKPGGHNMRSSSPGSRRGGGPQSVKSEGSKISFSNPANGGPRDIKQEI
jgi:hypothetical protein